MLFRSTYEGEDRIERHISFRPVRQKRPGVQEWGSGSSAASEEAGPYWHSRGRGTRDYVSRGRSIKGEGRRGRTGPADVRTGQAAGGGEMRRALLGSGRRTTERSSSVVCVVASVEALANFGWRMRSVLRRFGAHGWSLDAQG